MPQILSVSHRLRPQIRLNSAGDTQVAVCAPIIYLEATVTGDTQYHTTEWVQMSGSPLVTLETAGPLQAYYLVVGPPGTDKVFRFYIDRNTPFEQYMDVNIRTTPSTEIQPYEFGRGVMETTLPYFAYPFPVGGLYSSEFSPIDHFDSFGIAAIGSYDITWNYPHLFYEQVTNDRDYFRDRFVGTVAQTWTGSSWSIPEVFPFGTVPNYTVNTGEKVRIGALYSTNTTNDQVVWNPWFEAGSGGVVGHGVVGQSEYGRGNIQVAVTKLIFILTPLDPETQVTQSEYGRGYNQTSITKIAFVLQTLDYIDNVDQSEYGKGYFKFNVTRSSGGSLGG